MCRLQTKQDTHLAPKSHSLRVFRYCWETKGPEPAAAVRSVPDVAAFVWLTGYREDPLHFPAVTSRGSLSQTGPRIRTNASASEGAALIPAGDSEHGEFIISDFPHDEQNASHAVTSTELQGGGGQIAKETFQPASTDTCPSSPLQTSPNSSAKIVESTIIVVLFSENLDEYSCPKTAAWPPPGFLFTS